MWEVKLAAIIQPPLPAEVIQLAPRRKLPARTPVKLRTLTEIVGAGGVAARPHVASARTSVACRPQPPDCAELIQRGAKVCRLRLGIAYRRAICAEPAQLISTIQRSRQRLI